MGFAITSSAFIEGSPIPRKYTCDGANISPPLRWSGAPTGTTSYVLVLEDPDSPNPRAPQRTWVHWLLYDIPAMVHETLEGHAPPGAQCGLNSWNHALYGGPCPPIGRHRYFHKLYALDRWMPSLREPTKDELGAAMEGHVLGQAVLIGTYERRGHAVVR